MGDVTSGPVRLSFNPQLRVEFRGATVTSDAGLLLPRELDERLGLSTLIDRYLTAELLAARLQRGLHREGLFDPFLDRRGGRRRVPYSGRPREVGCS